MGRVPGVKGDGANCSIRKSVSQGLSYTAQKRDLAFLSKRSP